MSKLKFYLILGVVAIAILVSQFLPQKASAAYDMNLIVSDAQFTDYNTMSATDINNFLISKGSVYANYTIPEYVDVPYQYSGGNWGTVSTRQVNGATSLYGKTVAQLIYEECQSHRINPKMILAMMQKESSVIEQSSVSDTRLAWPLFYHYDETMAVFGYSQGTAEGIAVNYGGVGQQIAYSTWNFRDKFDRWNAGTSGNWRANISIDGVSIAPQSIATRLLYTYTPHSWQTFLNVLSRYGWWIGTYEAQWVTQSGFPTVGVGQTATMTISYRNTGSQTWTRGVVNLGTVNADYTWRTSGYEMADGWHGSDRPAYLNESSVAPGDIGTYTFTVTNNGVSAGNHRLHVGLVADGVTWFSRSTHAYWDVNVNPTYRAEWVTQSGFPTLGVGQSSAMTISYRNTGAQTWTRGTVNLGTVDTNYHWRTSSYNMASGWMSNDRPAFLNESSVAPGGIGTFTFYVQNNGVSVGNHRLDVGLVADGITWFSRATHAYWDVNVNTPYSAQWVTQSGYPTLGSGGSATMTISYRNTGSQTWTRGVVNLGTVDTNYHWRTSAYDMANGWVSADRPAFLNESSVSPGEIGTYTFVVARNGVPAGNYRLDVGLVADGITWFPRNTHAYWDVFAQ